MKIAVIGAGFIGQATGRGFAKHNNKVEFVDVDAEKVAQLRAEGFTAHMANEYSSVTTDVTMICVPTPTIGTSISLEYIKQVAIALGTKLKHHRKYHLVVVRSTVPPKTTREIVLPILEEYSGKKAGQGFGLAMQPEYLREVTAESDFARPWFVLIGEYDKKSGAILDKLYRPFNAPIKHCKIEEAEMQKYVHNVYNAVKIAFFNEMRILMQRMGWDAEAIFHATAQSCEGVWNPLYGLRDLGPFDGSCLPKDTLALLEWADKHEHNLGILRAVINENIKHQEIIGKNKAVRVNQLANVAV